MNKYTAHEANRDTLKAVIIGLLMLIFFMACTNTASAQAHCKAKKKDGTECKITKVNPEGYCRFHDPSNITCAGKKKDGSQCKMLVSKKGQYCRFHKLGS